MATCIVCDGEFNKGLFSFFHPADICDRCEEKIKNYLATAETVLQDGHFDNHGLERIQGLLTKYDLQRIIERCPGENKYRQKIKMVNLALLRSRFAEISDDRTYNGTELDIITNYMGQLMISPDDVLESNFGQDMQGYWWVASISYGLQGLSEMPIVKNPSMILQAQEICYVEVDADLMEEKIKTSYVGGHSGVSIRLSRNIRWNVGEFKGEKVQEATWEIIDHGVLAITSKRIVFVGSRKNIVIPIGKIVNIKRWSDAIAFQKENEEINKCFLFASSFYIDAVGMLTNHLATGGIIPQFQSTADQQEEKSEQMPQEENPITTVAKNPNQLSAKPDGVSYSDKAEATRILSDIAAKALAGLPNGIIRPNKKSKWAGEFSQGRYYKLWYDHAPWENHAFSYQLHIYISDQTDNLGVRFFFWKKDAINHGLSERNIDELTESLRCLAGPKEFIFECTADACWVEKFFNGRSEEARKEAAECLIVLISTITPVVENIQA